MAKDCHNYYGNSSYDFPMTFLWFSYDKCRSPNHVKTCHNMEQCNLKALQSWQTHGQQTTRRQIPWTIYRELLSPCENSACRFDFATAIRKRQANNECRILLCHDISSQKRLLRLAESRSTWLNNMGHLVENLQDAHIIWFKMKIPDSQTLVER